MDKFLNWSTNEVLAGFLGVRGDKSNTNFCI